MLELILAGVVFMATAGDSCSGSGRWVETCSAEMSDGAVEVGVDRSREGDANSGGEGESDDGGDIADRDDGMLRALECDDPLGRCGGFTVEVLEVSMSDIASLAPAPVTVTQEPDGVGVVGLPVNVSASATTHQRSTVLLDLPVEVRFTPLSYTFRYGDGSTREAASGGTSWSAANLAAFTETATSHVYASRGDYVITVDVHYGADVDFGSGWRPVDGTLTVPSSATGVEIFEARTALVEHTCAEDPAGVGC